MPIIGQRGTRRSPVPGRGGALLFTVTKHQTASTFMPTWAELKSELFRRMDGRRQHQSIFTSEQVYSFVLGCSKQFSAPGKTEAEQALQRIANEGTFLLVADTLSEFRQLLGISPHPRPEENPTEPSGNPSNQKPANAALVQQPGHSIEASASARPRSGPPFRPQRTI